MGATACWQGNLGEQPKIPIRGGCPDQIQRGQCSHAVPLREQALVHLAFKVMVILLADF